MKYDAEDIILFRSSGTEATCPAKGCHGGNAMLSADHWDGEELISMRKCRDCGFTVKNPIMKEIPYEDLISIKW